MRKTREILRLVLLAPLVVPILVVTGTYLTYEKVRRR